MAEKSKEIKEIKETKKDALLLSFAQCAIQHSNYPFIEATQKVLTAKNFDKYKELKAAADAKISETRDKKLIELLSKF